MTSRLDQLCSMPAVVALEKASTPGWTGDAGPRAAVRQRAEPSGSRGTRD